VLNLKTIQRPELILGYALVFLNVQENASMETGQKKIDIIKLK